jgi:phosphoribosylglycinamide formyltransferase-1
MCRKSGDTACASPAARFTLSTKACDEGPIITQAVVPVFPEDTEESLAVRILEQEHRIYPRAIQLYSEGRLRIEGRKVFVDGLAKEENQVLVQPPLKR